MATMPESEVKSPLTQEASDGILIHEKAEEMPSLAVGSYARLTSGKILGIAGDPARVRVSDDEGASWTEQENELENDLPTMGPTGALLTTRAGTVVMGFPNLAEKVWTWDDELRDAPGARLPTYASRSMDEGRTWTDVQKLHDEWTGANQDILQTRDGRVVFTSMQMRHNPGRHTCLTYGSEDDGKTWQPSNVIDLGGNGHHDGVTEGTIVELKDGTLLQYLRTNWGEFWRALSKDQGRTWHPYGPSGVSASSAPGMLERLQSGRIVLVWNRPWPEGEASYPLRGGDGIWSATPASNFREELSISFSEDECETWSPPVVIARNPGGEVSYPRVFEASPGVLWVTTHRWALRIRLQEGEFS
jgi:sialidase-1